MRRLCALTPSAWLAASELRIGLGCMRLSTEPEPERDEIPAAETIAAALAEGITVFDTAHAYARDQTEMGHNERLLAATLERPGTPRARIITKGGMARPAGGWVPDGRAKTILADCEASLAALGGLPIDLYLIHAPDPRTPWRTSLRALARLLDEGMVARVGVSNVNRRQLADALELAPVSAVEVGLSILDDRALRGGIVELCEQAAVTLIAHSPLGGQRRASALARRSALSDAAQATGATPAELALAWLLRLSPVIVAIPGARRPETARSAARAARLALDPQLALGLGPARATPSPRAAPKLSSPDTEVVLIMGIPGAGKTRLAEDYLARDYVRLNRDERGGGLRALADELGKQLEGGARRLVLDNTYLTRAARSYVIDAAGRHAAPTRCVWLQTPLAQAQVNLVERLLERFGALPSPDELRALARREPGALAPTQQMRALRELEPPSIDEGFAAIEMIEFERAPASRRTGGAVFVAAAALERPDAEPTLAALAPSSPHLLFDWRPDGTPGVLAPLLARLRATIGGPVETAVCPHGGGPPRCWCRPPLPGLPLAFARRHNLDPARSMLLGTSAAHHTLARAIGARYVGV